MAQSTGEIPEMEQHRMKKISLMEFLNQRTVKSILLPGGGIVLAAALLLGTNWSALSAANINFFYIAVFIAAALLSWRFHSTRILFSAVILLLGHHAMESYVQGQIASGRASRTCAYPYSPAYQDELSRLASRRAFNDALLRLKHPYAIAAVDIDHFKRINDNFGHDTGDQVLRLVASRLSRVSGGGEAFRV